MSRHSYLIDNGLESIDPKDILKEGYDKFYFIYHPYRYFKDVIYRNFKYKRIEMRKGFNPINTWDLSFYFWRHLFEMIKAYLDNADSVVDLDYHKFTYNGVEYTQKELLCDLKKVIKDIIFFDNNGEYDEARIKEKEALDMWYTVLPAMWW